MAKTTASTQKRARRDNSSAKNTSAERKRPKPQSADPLDSDGAEVNTAQKKLNLTALKFGIILIVTGIIGLFASVQLTLDKIHVLEDPSFQPVCNFNPIFSCESVMLSTQAEVAGIPNTLFGLVGFAMVIAIGAAIIAGGKFHRRFWQLWMLGMAGGLFMMGYLIFQSIYRLGTLCLFCMITWAALMPLIWYSFQWGLQHRYLPVPKQLNKVANFVRREHLTLLLMAYVFVVFLIVNHFWYYFKTL